MKKQIAFALLGVAGLTACSSIPESDSLAGRGSPESLLDVSSEVVSFQVADSASVDQVVEWINLDQPSSAELRCTDGEESCMHVQEVLAQFAVPYEFTPSAENALTLYYERIVTRDCDNRYVSNHINPYNLNHPNFGCSLAANMVQMISDQRQITNPALMGYADADKAYQVQKAYYTKPDAVKGNSDFSEKLSND